MTTGEDGLSEIDSNSESVTPEAISTDATLSDSTLADETNSDTLSSNPPTNLFVFLRKWCFLLGLCIAIPLLAAAVSVASHASFAAADQAKIELMTRDVWSIHTPYTGLISRYGLNHPGPLMFWLLSPAALIAKHSSTPVRVLNVLLLSGALIAAAGLAWSLGRRFFSVIVLSTLLALIGLPAEVIRVVWNPWFPIPFLVLLFVLVARVASGRTRDLIGVLIVGSIMVQTHAGTAPIVLALAIVALVFVVIDSISAQSMPERWRSTLAWIGGSALLLWILPIIGVFKGAGGNLAVLARYFLDTPETHLGIRPAIAMFAAEYQWRPPWLGGLERILAQKGQLGIVNLAAPSYGAYMIIPVVALTLGYLSAPSGAMQLWRRYIVAIAVILVAGVFAISRADGAFTYTFAWRVVIAPLSILVPAVPIFARIADRNFDGRRVLTTVVAVGVVVSCLVAAVRLFPKMHSGVEENLLTSQVIGSIARAIDLADVSGEKIAFRNDTDSFFGVFIADGVVNEMDRRGVRVVVPNDEYSDMEYEYNARAYGEHRVGPLSSASAVWHLVDTPDQFTEMESMNGSTMIWRLNPYSASAIFELPISKR
ncbi:hypothetical protein IMCC26256_11157 [Actinobacteria bacterium IMCC26256]|nr:hypothetical protein IMCC26256_11157 [Actinobacteria bacterium IMCC26256]